MFRSSQLLLPIALSATFLVGCGGGSSPSGGDTTAGNTTDGDTTAGNTTDGDNNSDSDKSFFNADDGLNFANILGESLSRVFDTATGAGGGAFGSSRIAPMGQRAFESSSTPCDSGSVDTAVTTNDATGELNAFSMQFNNCSNDGSQSSGSINLTSSGTGQDMQMSIVFDNFATNDASGSSSIDGTINVAGDESGDLSSFSVSGPSLTMVTDSESIVFTSYSLDVSSDDGSGASSIGATAQIDSNTDGVLSLSIDPPFVQNETTSDYPTSGRLVMTHSDGSRLEIQADNGDPASFDYVITDDGSTTSGTELWVNSDLIVD